MNKKLLIAALAVALVPFSLAEWSTVQRGQRYGGRQQYSGRRGVPDWQLAPEFEADAFTFVRIKYTSRISRWSRLGDWATDYPDSDLNFSFRLQQLTSLTVHPDGKVLELTDPELFDYPFVYMIEPGELIFDRDELEPLRRYCLNGGFLMVDDFWGEYEWNNFYLQIKRVFPDREPLEVPLEHEIFQCVYQLKAKPQVPSVGVALRNRGYGITWERRNSDTRTPHYRAIYDDQGRIMVFICFNTDLGDGWEREGEDEWYFHEFSEKKAYPMGINIVFYAMTH